MKLVIVLDRGERELRTKKIPIIKVLWRSSQMKEKTWEWESEMRRKYPELFSNTGQNKKNLNFENEIYIRRGEGKAQL